MGVLKEVVHITVSRSAQAATEVSTDQEMGVL